MPPIIPVANTDRVSRNTRRSRRTEREVGRTETAPASISRSSETPLRTRAQVQVPAAPVRGVGTSSGTETGPAAESMRPRGELSAVGAAAPRSAARRPAGTWRGSRRRRRRAAAAGRRGPCRSQPDSCSSQSRTYCLSNDGSAPPGCQLGGVPEPRGVGRQDLVGQHDGAVGAQAELELGVGQQQAAARGRPARPGRRRPASARAAARPAAGRRSATTVSKSTFSSCSPSAALVAGVKTGSGSREPSTSPSGSGTPQTRAATPGTPASRSRSGSRGPRTRRAPSPAARTRPRGRGTALGHVGGEHVVRHQVGELGEPPLRQLGEHPALVGDLRCRARSRRR